MTAPLARTVAVLALASILPGASLRAGAGGITLDELLFRANQYVVSYQQQVAGFIIEEQYEQRIVRRDGGVKQHRSLRSDYILVTVPGDSTWRGYRDVYEVDGAPVRDRQQRLADLFVRATDSVPKQATKVLNESARYNIGAITRNFNLPTMTLPFLDPVNQHRFSFEIAGEETVEGEPTVVLNYYEQRRPTFIQVPPLPRAAGMNIFSRGRFWLAPADGRLVKSELVAGDDKVGVKLRITVTYRLQPEVKLWLPAVMEEQYEDPRDAQADIIEGTARYSNYRKLFGTADYVVK